MKPSKQYSDAVLNFNMVEYPKIRAAQAFLGMMPNIIRDIVREYGEDSYAIRRIREGWSEDVQKTLEEALGLFERSKRRAIPVFSYESFEWAHSGADVFFLSPTFEILSVRIEAISKDSSTLRVSHRSSHRAWDVSVSDLGVKLFKTEYELYSFLLDGDRSIWIFDRGHFRKGRLVSVWPGCGTEDGCIQICVDGEEHLSLIGFREVNENLFINADSVASFLDGKDVWYTQFLEMPKHGLITDVNRNTANLLLGVTFDDGSSLSCPGLNAIGSYLFLSRLDAMEEAEKNL